MAIQTKKLVLAGLGITGNTPLDGVQPALVDGVHLRWSVDSTLGLPLYGFYLFRRLSQTPATTSDSFQFCDVMKTKGFTAPTTLGTTYLVEPNVNRSYWKVVSDQPLKLIRNPQFFARGFQVYSFDLSGRQYVEVFLNGSACQASVFIDFAQNGSIVVTAMLDDIPVATQTATGTTNTFREVRLQADHFTSIRFSSGPAVIGDIGWTSLVMRADTGQPWELVPGITQPITLPIGNAGYPARPTNTTYTSLRSTAISRVLYNRTYYQNLTPTLLTSTGTVSLTAGSSIVIGSGTNWTQDIVGEIFAPDGHWSAYSIAQVAAPNRLLLNRPYAGTTASGATYKITHDEIAQLYSDLMALFDGGSAAGAMTNRSQPPRIAASGGVIVTKDSDIVRGSGTTWNSQLEGLVLHVWRTPNGGVFLNKDSPFVYGQNTTWDDSMVGALFQISDDPSYYIIEEVTSPTILVLNRPQTGVSRGWLSYTMYDPTPYRITTVVSATELHLDQDYQGASGSWLYQLFASYSDATNGEVAAVDRQYPWDTVMLASLNPSIAQMLGLYVVDQNTGGNTYDYLIVGDYSNAAALNPQTAQTLVRSSGWGQIEAYLIQNKRAQPATALRVPEDVVAYALPAGSGGSGNNVGLRWTPGVTSGGNLQPDRPMLYHLWRATRTTALTSDPDALAGALSTPPAAADYTLLTQGQPIMVVENQGDSGSALPRPPDWPPYRLYALDGDLAQEKWYTYALTGVDLFGRHSPRVIAKWNQWLWNPPPELNLPRPWYFKDPAGEATRNNFGIELLNKVPPPMPVGVEAFLLDPADPFVVKDAAYNTWRSANPNAIGVRVRWQWTQRHADQAPNTAEFRIYYNPGPNAPADPQQAYPSWQTRINVQTYGGVRSYEVFLNLGSLVTLQAPDLATTTVYSYIGVSAADAKNHTRDLRTTGSNSNRAGNEGKVGGPSRIFRVLRTKPNSPGLPTFPPDRVFATKADYYGKSSYTYSWTPPPGPGQVLYAHIFRALDETLFQVDWDQRQVRVSKVLNPTNPAHSKYFPSEPRWDAAKQQQVANELNALNTFAYPTAKAQALAYYRGLSDDGLRVLAGLEGNQLAFTQLATFVRVTDDDTDDKTIALDASVGSYTDTTLDGRANNRYFYRVAFFDKANNLSELSIASPPVWLVDVMPPRTPTIIKAAAGDADRKITITWATVNREADLQEYRLYRAERPLAERELATTVPIHTRLSSSIPAGTTQVSWDDGAQSLAQHGYEDSTAQGWVARGTGVTLASVTGTARTGTRSLRTTGRTQTWNGPSLDLRTLLTKGATYQISGYVRLVTGQAATDLSFTVERTPTGGSAQFDRVAASTGNRVTDAGWVLLQGLYTYATDVSGLVLYLESTSATSQYYLDDFSITLYAPATAPLLQHGYEDSTAQGWVARGTGVTLASVTNAFQGGARSLRTTGRTQTWNGPSLDVRTLLTKGATYQISAYVRLVTGQPATDLSFSVERTLPGGSAQFDRVAGTSGNAVTATAWVQLQGLYTYTTDVSGLVLYLESTSATSQFYLDDFTISQVAPLASSVARHGYEDSTTLGWAPRGTGVTLASVTGTARSGTRSLRTTGRTQTWNGPSLDVRTLLARGATYQISGYVRLVTGQAATDLAFTVERTPVGGSAQFDRVAASTGNGVTAGAWVQLQGQYTYTSDVSSLVLYLESTSATSQYYLDDFSITLVAPPPALRGLVDYHYSLVAIDTAGNVSAPARAVARAYDDSPPIAPAVNVIWTTSTPAVARATWVASEETLLERQSLVNPVWERVTDWRVPGPQTVDDPVSDGFTWNYRVRIRKATGALAIGTAFTLRRRV
jgi:hypothetical protein